MIGILLWEEYVFWKVVQSFFRLDEAKQKFRDIVTSVMLFDHRLGNHNAIIDAAYGRLRATNIDNACSLGGHSISCHH